MTGIAFLKCVFIVVMSISVVTTEMSEIYKIPRKNSTLNSHLTSRNKFHGLDNDPSVPPTTSPTINPSIAPSITPSIIPSLKPVTAAPSIAPSRSPTNQPRYPTSQPSRQPTTQPSQRPSQPTSQPTKQPSSGPSSQPTNSPTGVPSSQPSGQPSVQPTDTPSVQPTRCPSCQPSSVPTRQPTGQPVMRPSNQPTGQPTRQPTGQPSRQPSSQPVGRPSTRPSRQPTGQPTGQPVGQPSSKPTFQPSRQPSSKPSFPGETRCPTSIPTSSHPTGQPSGSPTEQPSRQPSGMPSSQPSTQPVLVPTWHPTKQPDGCPTGQPSRVPTTQPTGQPVMRPTGQPSRQPTRQPTGQPSRQPTSQPTRQPVMCPTGQPSRIPTMQPTRQPFMCPTTQPSSQPTRRPTGQPTRRPSMQPSRQPASCPTSQPSRVPTRQPTSQPSRSPSNQPTRRPTMQPSRQPFSCPTLQPFSPPTGKPTQQPSRRPTMQPSGQPSGHPTRQPVMVPTSQPSLQPFSPPTGVPSVQPSGSPSLQPFSPPTGLPSQQPTRSPTQQPSSVPSMQPSAQPTGHPTRQPSAQPSTQPSRQPSSQPTRQPSGQPTSNPTAQPTAQPFTSQPTSSYPIMRGFNRTRRPTPLPSQWPTSLPSLLPTLRPTDGKQTVWKQHIQAILRSASARDSLNAVVDRVNYYELTVDQSALYGGCDYWKAFQTGRMVTNAITLQPASIQYTLINSLNNNHQRVSVNTTFTCSHKRNVTLLTNHLNTQNPRTNLTQVCDGHVWQVKRCPIRRNNNDFALSMCVDCANPCATDSQCIGETLSGTTIVTPNVHSITPCLTTASSAYCYVNNNNDITQKYAIGRVLSVAFTEIHPAPNITHMTITPQQNSVTINAQMNSVNGTLFCAAYEVKSSTVYPSSQNDITSQNHFASITDSTATLTISQLVGNSHYYLYCAAYSVTGSVSSMSTVNSNKRSFSTLCCKTIFIEMVSNTQFMNTVVPNILRIRADSNANDRIALNLFGINTLNRFTQELFSPNTITFDVNTPYIPSTQFYTVNLRSTPRGNFQINASLSGAEQLGYNVVYTRSTILNVIDDINPPLAPVMLSVVFSADGATLLVTFDSPSNKGKMSTMFACSKLFVFRNSAASTCQWVDNASIRVFLSSGDQSVGVGDSFSVLAGVVQPLCTSTVTNCLGWDTVHATTLKVQAPLFGSAVVPSVALSLPSVIGVCDSLNIDLTASTGSAGRSYRNITFAVSSSLFDAGNPDNGDVAGGDSASSALIQQYLTLTASSTLPMNVPASMLDKGVFYFVSATLCNIFNKCGQASARVVVLRTVVPVVNITGLSVRSLTRNSPLTLTSGAYIATSCNAITGVTSVVTTGLDYSWFITINGVPSLTLTSTSKDPSRFLLPPYSLLTSSVYVITLTTSYARLLVASSASVIVLVRPGNLVALIKGGQTQRVTQGEVITLDASSSYDEDVSSTDSGDSSTFTYLWSCVQTSPDLLTYCGMGVLPGIYSTTSVQQFVAGAVNSTSQVSLTIRDKTLTRTSTVFMTITTVASRQPVVTINSDFTKRRVNIEETVQLSGSVSLHKALTLSATLVWSLDESSVDLTTASLLPSAVSYTQAAVVNATTRISHSLSFALRPFSLPTGATLTFYLTCTTAVVGVATPSVVITSLQITTNSPPQPGVFFVTPTVGRAASTMFQFNTRYWSDTDLPLTYTFNIITPSTALLPVKARSEVTSANTLLPAGSKVGNYSLTCGVMAFDALGANNSLVYNVVVRPLNEANFTSFQSTLQKTITTSKNSTNPTTLLQSTTLIVNTLNSIDCTLAPNCSALNRLSCVDTPQTCGACLTSSLVGQAADSNSRCITPTQYNAVSNITTGVVTINCTHNDNCSSIPWLQCDAVAGECAQVNRECSTDCSGHGSCSFVNTLNQTTTTFCTLGATDCAAVCTCESEFYGSSCQYTYTQYRARLALRSQTAASLVKLVSLQDPTAEAITSWSASLQALTARVDELSVSTALSAQSVAATILQSAVLSDANVNYASVSRALQAVDDVMSMQIGGYKDVARQKTGRRLGVSGGGNYYFDTQLAVNSTENLQLINTTQYVLQQYGELVTQSMVADQTPVLLIHSQFRVTTHKYGALTSSSNQGEYVIINAPLTSNEVAQNVSASFVRVLHNSTASELSLSGVVYSSDLYHNPSFSSNPLQIQFTANSLPCDTPSLQGGETSVCEVQLEVTLFNNLAVDYSDRSPEYLFAQCHYDDYTLHQYRCADNYLINATCNGTLETLRSRCPYVQPMGLCSSVVGVYSDRYNGCNAVSYDGESTTCLCTILDSNIQRNNRLLLSTSAANLTRVSANGLAHYVSTVNYQAISAEILHLPPPAPLPDHKASWKVISTLAGVIAFMLLLGGWAYRKENPEIQEKKVQTATRKKQAALLSLNQRYESKKNMMSTNKGGVSNKIITGSAAVVATKQIAHKKHMTASELRSFQELDRRYKEYPELKIIDHSLPHVYRSGSFQIRFWSEMKQYHKYLNILWYDSAHYSRVFRLVSLTSNVISVMFMLAVVYDLANPDDGSCEAILERRECLEARTSFSLGNTVCHWDRGTRLGSCHFKQPKDDVGYCLFVAVLAAVVASPIMFISEWVTETILAAPTKKRKVAPQLAQHFAASSGVVITSDSGQQVVVKQRQREYGDKSITSTNNVVKQTIESSSGKQGSGRGSVNHGPGRVSVNHGVVESASSKGRGSVNAGPGRGSVNAGSGSKKSKKVKNPFMPLLTAQNVDISTEKEDITSLLSSLREFREQLGRHQRRIFDKHWGLQSSGENSGAFVTQYNAKAVFLENNPSCCWSPSSWFLHSETPINVLEMLTKDLKYTRMALKNEVFVFKKHIPFPEDRKNRLMFLFLKDLMFGLNSQIFVSKQSRQVLFTKQVIATSKMKGWIFVLLLDIGMLVYIYIFALKQTEIRQKAWFQSLFIWLILEFFLVSVAASYFTHLFVPLLIQKEVDRVKFKAIECIREYNRKVSFEASEHARITSRLHEIDHRAGGDDCEEYDDEGNEIPSQQSVKDAVERVALQHELTQLAVNAEKESQSFNAARTLFLSHRLALEFMEYRESRIIASFVTLWPIQAYIPAVKSDPQSSTDVPVSKNRLSLCWKGFSHSVTSSLLYLLSCFLVTPHIFQDICVYIVVFVVTSFWVYVHILLFRIYPAYAFIPTIIGGACLHFKYRTTEVATERKRFAKLTPIVTDYSSDAGGGSLRASFSDERASEKLLSAFDLISLGNSPKAAGSSTDSPKSFAIKNLSQLKGSGMMISMRSHSHSNADQEIEKEDDARDAARANNAAEAAPAPAMSRVRRIAQMATRGGNAKRQTMLSKVDQITSQYVDACELRSNEDEDVLVDLEAGSLAQGDKLDTMSVGSSTRGDMVSRLRANSSMGGTDSFTADGKKTANTVHGEEELDEEDAKLSSSERDAVSWVSGVLASARSSQAPQTTASFSYYNQQQLLNSQQHPSTSRFSFGVNGPRSLANSNSRLSFRSQQSDASHMTSAAQHQLHSPHLSPQHTVHKTDELRGAALGSSFDSVNFAPPNGSPKVPAPNDNASPKLSVQRPSVVLKHNSAIESFKAFSTTPRGGVLTRKSMLLPGDIESQSELHEEDSDDSLEEGFNLTVRRPEIVAPTPPAQNTSIIAQNVPSTGGAPRDTQSIGYNLSAASAVVAALSSLDKSSLSNTSAKLRMDYLDSEETLSAELQQKRETMLSNLTSRLGAVKATGTASTETVPEGGGGGGGYSKPQTIGSSKLGTAGLVNIVTQGQGGISNNARPNVNSFSVNTTSSSKANQNIGSMKLQQSPKSGPNNNTNNTSIRRAEEITREFTRSTKAESVANERKKAQAQSKVAERLSQKKK